MYPKTRPPPNVTLVTTILLSVLLATAAVAQAPGETPPDLEPLPEAAPAAPTGVQSGRTIEPEVVIIEREDERIEQYSVNGEVYMVKVTPKVGPSYYFVDTDGDGALETRRDDLDADFVVPQWVLFRW